MQSDSSCERKQPIILYIIIAIVLAASLIFCVRWLKSRSYSLSNQAEVLVSEDQNDDQTSEEVGGSVQDSTESNDLGSTEVIAESSQEVSNDTSEVTSVPSAGTGHFVLPAIGLGCIAFAAQFYAKSRRKLRVYQGML